MLMQNILSHKQHVLTMCVLLWWIEILFCTDFSPSCLITKSSLVLVGWSMKCHVFSVWHGCVCAFLLICMCLHAHPENTESTSETESGKHPHTHTLTSWECIFTCRATVSTNSNQPWTDGQINGCYAGRTVARHRSCSDSWLNWRNTQVWCDFNCFVTKLNEQIPDTHTWQCSLTICCSIMAEWETFPQPVTKATPQHMKTLQYFPSRGLSPCFQQDLVDTVSKTMGSGTEYVV